MSNVSWRRFWRWLSTAVERQKREAVEHDEEPHIREQFFDFASLPARLKLLTGIVIAEVLAGAAALAGVVQCCGNTTLYGLDAYLPSADYALTYVSLMFGFLLITTGMASARWAGTVLLSLIIVLFFATALFGFFSGAGRFLEMAVSILGVTVLWFVLVNALPALYRARFSPERRRMWVLYLFLALGFGLWAMVLWAAPLALGTMLIILHQALVFFYVLAGADWAELSDTVVRFATKRLIKPDERPATTLYATMLLAALMILVTAALSPARIFLFALTDAPAVCAAFAGLRLARFQADWPRRFSWPLLAAIAFSTIFGNVAIFHGASWVGVEMLYAAVMGALLIAGGRSRHYAVVGPAALLGLIYSLNTLMSVAINPAFAPYLSTQGIFLAAASLVLSSAAWFWWQWRRGAIVGRPAGLLFVFVAGLWLLYALWGGFYEMIRFAGEKAAILAGILLFVTILIDVMLSGGSITNVDGRLFPRAVRVRLFFGYVLLVVASVLFWGSLQGTGAIKEIAKMYSPDLFVQAGIAGYGVSMLTALVVLRFAHWRVQLANSSGATAGDAGETLSGPGDSTTASATSR